MKNTQSAPFFDRIPEHQSHVQREAYIKSFSQRTGEQAGKLVADFLDGILFLFLVDRSPGSVRSPAAPPGSKSTPAVLSSSETLLTASDIIVILNISKSKAYRMIQNGEIPAVRFGRTARVREQDFEEFLNNHIVHAI